MAMRVRHVVTPDKRLAAHCNSGRRRFCSDRTSNTVKPDNLLMLSRYVAYPFLFQLCDTLYDFDNYHSTEDPPYSALIPFYKKEYKTAETWYYKFTKSFEFSCTQLFLKSFSTFDDKTRNKNREKRKRFCLFVSFNSK